MAEKVVFLDRDGVINVDPGGRTGSGYVTSWEEFSFLPDVLKALKVFRQAPCRVVVISNQQGVGKGLYSEGDLNELTSKMSDVVRAEGGQIDSVYYCTHLESENCSCRKPDSGLFEKAFKDEGIEEASGLYYIGDTERDIIAGANAGLGTILVLSGKSTEADIEKWAVKPDRVFNTLLEAARHITGADIEGA